MLGSASHVRNVAHGILLEEKLDKTTVAKFISARRYM